MYDSRVVGIINTLQSHCGVILIRCRNQSPGYVIPRLISLLDMLKNKVKNSLILINEDLVKIEKKK